MTIRHNNDNSIVSIDFSVTVTDLVLLFISCVIIIRFTDDGQWVVKQLECAECAAGMIDVTEHPALSLFQLLCDTSHERAQHNESFDWR